MKRILLMMLLAMLLAPSLVQAAAVTATWDVPAQNTAGGPLTDSEKAAIVTVIEAGTLTTDHVLAWTEVGKSDAGATTWKGAVPDNVAALRAKHILNGLSSPWATISATVQPSGIVIIIK